MPYYPLHPGNQSPDHPPRKQIILRRMLLCASLLLIAYGAVRLFFYASDWASSRQTTQELREIARETDVTDATAFVSGTEPPALEVTSTPLPSTPQPEDALALSDELPVIEYPNGYNLVPRILHSGI